MTPAKRSPTPRRGGSRLCTETCTETGQTLTTLLTLVTNPDDQVPTLMTTNNWSSGCSIIRLSHLRRWAVSRGRKSLIHRAGILPSLPSETVEIIEHSRRVRGGRKDGVHWPTSSRSAEQLPQRFPIGKPVRLAGQVLHLGGGIETEA